MPLSESLAKVMGPSLAAYGCVGPFKAANVDELVCKVRGAVDDPSTTLGAFESYAAMLEEQGGVGAVCEEDPAVAALLGVTEAVLRTKRDRERCAHDLTGAHVPSHASEPAHRLDRYLEEKAKAEGGAEEEKEQDDEEDA